ncbi:hypothetical protein D9C73_017642 [Collichthys lucidus]|uniref:Uncharacterized protein n=1 Tax=Collichthys lucidus TaxID=240159 RepID=A0A4U5V763_COLLU|nr:hypothetical protein D9C73_017642 [Collichthys lucidus]
MQGWGEGGWVGVENSPYPPPPPPPDKGLVEERGGVGGWSAAVKVAQCGIVGKVSDQGATSLDIYHNYYCRSLTGTEIKCAVTGPHAHAGSGVGKARASKESRSALLTYVSKIGVFQPRWQNKRPPSSAVP